MDYSDQKITVEDAQSSLKMIQDAKEESIKSFRPTVLISLIASALFGLETTAAGYSSGDSLWSFITIVSTVLFLAVLSFWYFSMRFEGKKMRIKPNGTKGVVFVLIQIAIITAIVIGAIEFYKSGISWAPIVGGAFNAFIVLASLHYFPTSEFSLMEMVGE